MRIKILFSFLFLFILFALFYRTLLFKKPNEIPSALIGQNVPHFQLPNLLDSQNTFTQNDLHNKVTLLNVWATWCQACALEHEMLIKISEHYHIPIYSIDYKDDPELARLWLQAYGNPYTKTGNDSTGNTAIDFGVYGTPETFLINRENKIVYRHVGAIDQKTWDEILFPIVKKYER